MSTRKALADAMKQHADAHAEHVADVHRVAEELAREHAGRQPEVAPDRVHPDHHDERRDDE